MDAYLNAKNQSSLQSWHIAYSILGITFDIDNDWTESNRWTYVCLTAYTK